MKRIAAANASMGVMSKVWDDDNVDTYSKHLLFKATPLQYTPLGMRKMGLEKVSPGFSRSLPAQRNKKNIKDKDE